MPKLYLTTITPAGANLGGMFFIRMQLDALLYKYFLRGKLQTERWGVIRILRKKEVEEDIRDKSRMIETKF